MKQTKEHTKQPKGLTDEQLVAKYEAGSFDFKKVKSIIFSKEINGKKPSKKSRP